MAKKNFDSAVQNTVKSQSVAAQNQFDKTDTILLKVQSSTPTRPPRKESSVERSIFSMPATDLALIDMMRSGAGKSGRVSTSKSEIVRAGLHALTVLEDPEFLEMLNHLQKVKRAK